MSAEVTPEDAVALGNLMMGRTVTRSVAEILAAGWVPGRIVAEKDAEIERLRSLTEETAPGGAGAIRGAVDSVLNPFAAATPEQERRVIDAALAFASLTEETDGRVKQVASSIWLAENSGGTSGAAWAEAAWADMTFPADDWSEEAVEMLAVARAVLAALREEANR